MTWGTGMNNISEKLITNQNDIYIFFEIIKQIEPKSIIDLGMFLKRIGNISRQTANEEISGAVRMDAVDYLGDLQVPVYERVYNNIYNEFREIEEIFSIDCISLNKTSNVSFGEICILKPKVEVDVS